MIDTTLDPSRSWQLVILGRKGEGKSEDAALYYVSYPYDRLVLDTTGDVAAGPLGHEPGTLILRGEEVPSRWPDPPWGQERSSVIYVPDPTSPTYQDDMDRMMGLAFRKGRILVWVDEAHEIAKAGQTKPHTRRVLRQGRHRQMVTLWCDPRAMDLDLLILHNSDLVIVYRLPQKADRLRVIDTVGLDEEQADQFFYGAVEDLPEGSHRYIRIDPAAGVDDRLVLMPPLPLREPLAREAAGVGS